MDFEPASDSWTQWQRWGGLVVLIKVTAYEETCRLVHRTISVNYCVFPQPKEKSK